MATQWSYAELGPDGLALVDEAERLLASDIVMVYRPSSWGTVDPETVADYGLTPDELAPDQLDQLRRLEARVGGVMVAYRRAAH